MVITLSTVQFGSPSCTTGELSSINAWYSTNRGSSWVGPATVGSACGNSFVGYPTACFNNTHRAVVAYIQDQSDGQTRLIKAAISRAALTGFNSPMTAATTKVEGADGFGKADVFIDPTPSCAGDLSTAFPGRIHIVYAGGNLSVSDAQSSNKKYFSPDVFAVHTDNFVTFSSPVKVNDNIKSTSTLSDEYAPRVVVDPTGWEHVGWYDRRVSPYVNINVEAATSTDGGKTFSSNVKVSPAASVPSFGDFGLEGGSSGGVRDHSTLVWTSSGPKYIRVYGPDVGSNDVFEDD